MARGPQQQPQQQQQSPAPVPDDGRLETPFGRMEFPPVSSEIPVVSKVKVDCTQAISALETGLKTEAKIVPLIESLLNKGPRSVAAQAALDSNIREIAGYLATSADQLETKLQNLPSEKPLSECPKAMVESLTTYLKDMFLASNSDPKVAAALTAVSLELLDSTPPVADKKSALEAQLSEKITEALISGGALPFVLESQEFSVGRGSVSIVFNHTAAGHDVEIINNFSGVKAKFPVGTLTGDDLQAFDELQIRLGKDSLTTYPTTKLSRRDRIPSLTGEMGSDEIKTIYRLLSTYSKGQVTFETIPLTSQDLVLRPVQARAAANPDLLVTASYPANAAQVVAGLTAEKSSATAGTFVPTENQLQLNHAVAADSVTFSRAASRGSSALEEIVLRSELGQYFVDLKIAGSNGQPATVSVLLDAADNASVSILVDRVAAIADQFATEQSPRLAESEAIKAVLEMGKITSIKGEDPAGRKTELRDFNWLGQSMTTEAEISGIAFVGAHLDISGKGIKFTDCTFTNCAISFFARDVEFKNVTFDKQCVYYGALTGTLENSAMKGNAYQLDFRGVTLKDQDKITKATELRHLISKSFGELILDHKQMPEILKGVVISYYDKNFKAEQNRISALFNGDVLLARLVINEPDLLKTRSRSLLNLWGVREQYLEDAERDLPPVWSKFVTERDRIDDQMIVDFFPPQFDPSVAGDPMILRVYIDDEKKMKFCLTMAGTQTFPDFDEAKKYLNSHPGSLVLGEGNLETFKAVLNFQHYNIEDLMGGVQNAVVVPASPAPAPPGP